MGNFGESLTPARARQKAKEHWDWWRLVLEAGLDYNAVFHQMLPEEILEANAAYDLFLKAGKTKK